MKRFLSLLGLNRLSPATIPVFIVTGGGALIALRENPLPADAGLGWNSLYLAVTVLSVALVLWGVLYLIALVVRAAALALGYRKRIAFQWPVYIRPEEKVEPAIKPPPEPTPAEEFEFFDRKHAEGRTLPTSGKEPTKEEAEAIKAAIENLAKPPDERAFGPGDIEARLVIRQDGGNTMVGVLNDGPTGEFTAEVISVTSPHFHAKAEKTNWPWVIGWGGQNEVRAKSKVIKTAGQAEIVLVRYDERGARLQLTNQGGHAFVFLGPATTVHGIHGRLGISNQDELKAEILEVTFRITRVGDPALYRERKVCVAYLGIGKFCDQTLLTR